MISFSVNVYLICLIKKILIADFVIIDLVRKTSALLSEIFHMNMNDLCSSNVIERGVSLTDSRQRLQTSK